MLDSRAITRQSASNLALAFVLLPRAKRRAMCALYAFCRSVDDVADEESRPVAERRALLAAWREDLALACGQGQPRFPVSQELQPYIRQHRLPFALFDELIRGCEMDLDIHRYETWAELEQYCFRVASAVGLLSIEVFGYRNPACRHYAWALGQALQLTNILRDVRADAQRGRLYLPLSELRACGLSPEEVLRLQYSDRFRQVASRVAQRAKAFYAQARRSLPAEDRRAMRAAELMGSVYWRLLTQLEQRQFNVFGPQPPRLSAGQKLLLVGRAWWGGVSGALAPSYGSL